LIPVEKLKRVRTIITHANCPDGIASAILLHDALPNAQIKFVTHGTKEYRELPAEDGMLFCDIAPPAERAHEFLPRVPVVLDHHKGAEHLVKSFTHHVFADEKLEHGVSGAVLAFREVWVQLRFRDGRDARKFARLAGVRDTWQTADPDFQRSNEQAAALTFWPVEKWLSLDGCFDGDNDEFEQMLALGSVLFAKRLEAAKKAASQAWCWVTANDTRCLIFEGTTLTSDVAEMVHDVDLVMGFGFIVEDGKFLLNVSMRSHTSFDCMAFAKRFGGGGHTRAAGFTLLFTADAKNPYALLVELVGGWKP
jgi:hypothetical protein